MHSLRENIIVQSYDTRLQVHFLKNITWKGRCEGIMIGRAMLEKSE